MRDDPVRAFPKEEGYLLLGDTFPIREQIKAAGGRWLAAKKSWTIDEEGLAALKVSAPGVQKLTRAVTAAWCHNPVEETMVDETDLARRKHLIGCSRCDTPIRCGKHVDILYVAGDPPATPALHEEAREAAEKLRKMGYGADDRGSYWLVREPLANPWEDGYRLVFTDEKLINEAQKMTPVPS